jgi:hypothetical protein
MDAREELMKKARERLAQQKATTADDPQLVPNSYPPELKTPSPVVYQDTKGNPMGVLEADAKVKFWCALRTGEVHLRNGGTIKFVNHEFKTNRTEEIAALRERVRMYPGKFKEI